jgi:hypothetical protein
VRALPESAVILFGGGSRGRSARDLLHPTRAKLEATTKDGNAAIVSYERRLVDARACWPGPEELWTAVETTPESELARYAYGGRCIRSTFPNLSVTLC